MKLQDIDTIAVLGAGIMGHGIAQTFLMGGYRVCLFDINQSILDSAEAHIRENLALFQTFGLIEEKEIDPAMERLSLTTELGEAVKGADFIVEAAPEDLELKQELYRKIEEMCGAETIIATNTSSLTLKDISRKVNNRGRLVITHWFNPPHIVPVVEVVKGEDTTDEVMDTTYALLEKVKKVPIRINREVPGFIVNRIQVAMVREVLDLFEKGLASAEDIDKAIKGTIGFRLASIGPLLTIDLAGVKLWLRVFENLLPNIRSSQDAPEVLKNLSDAGHDGIKSGKGFYDYSLAFGGTELDEAVKNRDNEFLKRLKSLYWKK